MIERAAARALTPLEIQAVCMAFEGKYTIRNKTLFLLCANTGAGGTAGRSNDAVAITELLLAYGGDPFMKDKRGRMVIDSARNKEILNLLQKGIDPSVADLIVDK